MTRVGVIGCGRWGTRLLRNVAAEEWCVLAGLADVDPWRLRAAAAAHPRATPRATAGELFDAADLDAVVIATPPESHFPLALEALRRGLHVLVEKPMATSLPDARALADAGRAHERVLMVDHTFLFTPAVQALRREVRAGALGRAVTVRAERRNREGGRHGTHLLLDLAPHDLAILDHVVARPALEVSARRLAGAAGEEAVELGVRFDGGLEARVVLGRRATARVRRLELAGTTGRAVYDGSTPTGRLETALDGAPLRTLVPGGAGELEPLRGVVRHFAACVRSGARARSDARSGLVTVGVIEAALASLERGRPVAPWVPAD